MECCGLVLAFLWLACGHLPPLLIGVGIRRWQLGFGAIEPSFEGVGEVGGLFWPVGGDVARFVGVFAEVEDLGARTDDEFTVGFVVGRESGGVEVVAKPVDELPIALADDGAGRAAVVRGVGGHVPEQRRALERAGLGAQRQEALAI
jgi:hypothetical protein